MFPKSQLDKAHKDKGKRFSPDFAVQLIFSDPPPQSSSSDYSSSLSSHASRSSFGGAGGGSSSSSSATINQNQDVTHCMKKLNKLYPDHHHQQTRSGLGSLLKTRTSNDVMSVVSSCIGAEDENDDIVFGREQKGHRHRHHGVVGVSSANAMTDSSPGVRINRNHSSTSSCSSSSSSSASCSENNSSCSNSSSTENCSQLTHHNNNKK